MAEYDNLLAELRIVSSRGDMSSRSELKAKLFEALIAVRALQTENTELRGRVKNLLNEQVAGIGFMNRAHAAERLITEALERTQKGYPWVTAPRTVRDLLSSYPLGEGQTPKLDPKPMLFGRWRHAWDPDLCPVGGYKDICTFAPEPQYSQNRADYEGQTQQGDER